MLKNPCSPFNLQIPERSVLSNVGLEAYLLTNRTTDIKLDIYGRWPFNLIYIFKLGRQLLSYIIVAMAKGYTLQVRIDIRDNMYTGKFKYMCILVSQKTIFRLAVATRN